MIGLKEALLKRRWIPFVVSGLIICTPLAVALAHPGHMHKVMGTVTVIDGNRVEVADAAGKITTHMLDAKTKIRKGTTVLKAADIKVGDRVVISSTESKDKAGKAVMTVTEVQVGSATAPASPKKG